MDVIGVLEVLSRRALGAGPQVGGGRFIKTPISPQVEHYFKRSDLCVTPTILGKKLRSRPENNGHVLTTSHQETFSTGRVEPLKSLGFFPITWVYHSWVQEYIHIKKVLVKTTS